MEGKISDPDFYELWQEHQSARFPKSFGGKDVNGIDFDMVDSDVTGIIGRFLAKGSLSVRHVAYLGLRYHDLNYIVPILNEAGADYFWRLGRLAELVLRELAKPEPSA